MRAAVSPSPLPDSRPNWIVAALAAVQFLTVLPPVVQRMFTATELGWAAGFFPLVGLLIGAVVSGVAWLLGYFLPDGVCAALVLTIWTLSSGALHLDGFLDACDGLLGGFDPESRLRILKDERKGAFAVTGGILLLLVKFTALQALLPRLPILLLIPVLGRWVMTLAIFAFPYARPEGLGKAMHDHTRWGQVFLSTLTAVAAAVLLAGWWGCVALLLALLVMGLVARFTLQRIPGLTGDIYGAMNELTETALLILFCTL